MQHDQATVHKATVPPPQPLSAQSAIVVADAAQVAYFEALKNAVRLIPEFFGGAQAVDSARAFSDLRPDIAAIREAIAGVSFAQEAFLVALVGFFDEGHARGFGSCNLHYLTRTMSPDQRERIAAVMVAFP